MKYIFYAMLLCSFSAHAMEKAESKQSNSEKERFRKLISISSQGPADKLSVEAKANSIVTTVIQRTQSMDIEAAKTEFSNAYIELDSLKMMAYKDSVSKHQQIMNRCEEPLSSTSESIESVWQEYRIKEVKITLAQHDLLKYGTQNSVFTGMDIKYIDKQLSGDL